MEENKLPRGRRSALSPSSLPRNLFRLLILKKASNSNLLLPLHKFMHSKSHFQAALKSTLPFLCFCGSGGFTAGQLLATLEDEALQTFKSQKHIVRRPFQTRSSKAYRLLARVRQARRSITLIIRWSSALQ